MVCNDQSSSKRTLDSKMDHIPVGLCFKDFSRVKDQVDRWRAQGMADIPDHLANHPEVVTWLFSLIRVNMVNQTALRMHRAPDMETLVERLPETIPPRSQAILKDALVALIEGQSHFESQLDLLTLDAKPLPVYMRLVKDREDDDWSEILVSYADLSRQKEEEKKRQDLERRVMETQKLESLGCLASGVAHDFNNLLVSILGNADLALQEIEEESPASLALQEIHKASLKAADLCRQMLSYSGQGKSEFDLLDLNQLTQGLRYLVRSLIPRKIELRQLLSDPPPVIQGDSSQIQQMIVNLVSNSVEALGSEKGRILIETGLLEAGEKFLLSVYTSCPLQPGPYAFLKVEDDGPGIPEKFLGQIFDPFFTTKLTSRGMGLAAVQGIARMHEGGVIVQNGDEGGTRMMVLLPMGTKTPEAVRPALPAEEVTTEWNASGRILLVDDEPGVRRVGTRMLVKLGFEVVLAEDGLQAVEIFHARHEEIDGVILDLTMPRMNGHEAMGRMLDVDPEMPIFISSGFSERESVPATGPRLHADFIQKPYTLKRVRRALQCIEQRKS